MFEKKYDTIITFENLFSAWKEFVKDKSKKPDVAMFSGRLMDNLKHLHVELKARTYKHGDYIAFKINDPKPRDIHKALVRDRIIHHLLYKNMYEFFDETFVYDSYSCRINKGTHRAINRFRACVLQVSKNKTKQCYVLKCDIRKFFASIDHDILKSILLGKIQDKEILSLWENIIDSFSRGLPLGNLTSQLLVNVYMNEFDWFVKRVLRVKYYIRYADDFVVISQNKEYLECILERIEHFLFEKLKLTLHPDKVFIKTIYSGIDFLGWVEFGNHRVFRNSTKRRMCKKLLENNYKKESVDSYVGVLSHGNTYTMKNQLKSVYLEYYGNKNKHRKTRGFNDRA